MSKISPKMWYLLKVGFLALVSTGIFVAFLPVSKPGGGPDWLDLLGVNFSEPYYDVDFSSEILLADVSDCLMNINKARYQKDVHKEFETYARSFANFTSNDIKDETSNIFTVITSFNNILSLLDIKAVIIEPSVLYCMLLPEYRELLVKRRFNISQFLGTENILTYGIQQADATVLQRDSSTNKFAGIGFRPFFVHAPAANWMQHLDSEFEFLSVPSHIFYKHNLCAIHLVVFYERNSYLWHAGLDSEDNTNIAPKHQLMFVEHESAYEKFYPVSLENKMLPVADFYVPTNAHYFLLELLSSRFLECNSSRAANVFSAKNPRRHPGMSVQRFNMRSRIVLRELKKIFHPLLMNFWIWSGTMLGWYRQCDIIPYTSDVDFASWASDIDNLETIINKLLDNKYVTIKEKMGVLEEALEFNIDCHSLRTDVFFMYRVENGSWCSGHVPRGGYYFRYFYPPFTICSAELLGEKVQVPCETEDVIVSEYGLNWKKPVSSWHYESSVKNRGPNIYWEKKRLAESYQVY